MTEIELRQERDSWIEPADHIFDLAKSLAETTFVPAAMRKKPFEVAAAILAGREVGVSPMAALSHIDVINGTPAIDAEMMRALIFKAGHSIQFIESTASRCVVQGRRAGESDWTKVSFTIDEARQMGLAAKDNWKRQPQNMLVARATSRLARLIFPDVIGGLSYTADEVEAVEVVTGDGEVIEAKPTKKIQRKELEPVEVVEAEIVELKPPFSEPAEIVDLTKQVDETVAESKPPMITEAQKKKLHTLYGVLGVTDRDERLLKSRDILRLEKLESSLDLTKDQATYLIDTLESITNPRQDTTGGDDDAATDQIF